MARITVFGATGRTGRLLVAQALGSGNQVVVYLRNPSKLGITHGHLSVVAGEMSDPASIEQVVRGAEAIISVLGPRGGSKGKPLTVGMQNIIAAMKKEGTRRLVVTSTLSAPDPDDRPDRSARTLVNFVRLTMRDAYEDIIGLAHAVRRSELDWTIVRLTTLTNKPASGQVRIGYLGRGEIGMRISRADLADFLLKQVRDTKYLRQAPAISN